MDHYSLLSTQNDRVFFSCVGTLAMMNILISCAASLCFVKKGDSLIKIILDVFDGSYVHIFPARGDI